MPDDRNQTELLTTLPAEPIERAGAPELLEWGTRTFPGRALLSVSFGGGGLVLAHMVSRLAPEVPVAFLDTGLHFAETYAFRNAFTAKYGLRRLDAEPAEDVGPLFRIDPERCCNARKVEPMTRLLAGFDLWITAIRRDQSAERSQVRKLELVRLPDGRTVHKLNPIADWTRERVDEYTTRHELPRHPLADRGYTSIGCWPCTRPVRPGESERAGRWAGREKTECGLHRPGLVAAGGVA